MKTHASTISEAPKKRLSFASSMRGTLLTWFILLAIVPVVIVSAIFLVRVEKVLLSRIENKLVAVREIKETVLKTFFGKWRAEVLFISQLETLKSDMADMAVGFEFLGPKRVQSLYGEKPELEMALDGSAYSAVHREQHLFFKKFVTVQGYEDILFVDMHEHVIYTLNKGPVFGAELNSPPYTETGLAVLVKALRTAGAGAVLTEDAGLFEGEVALFMGTPVFREDVCLGYLIFRLPFGYIGDRVSEREGMGETGETYLVGPDKRMRSNAFNDPVNHSVKASLAGTIHENGVDTQAVRKALAGETGSGIITDYRGQRVLASYAPVELNGLKWVIVAEVDIQEALAPAVAVRRITIGIGAGIALLAILLSLIVSGRIVMPIRKLTKWAGSIAGGSLELVDVKTPANEIGQLNDSFREAVKSLQRAETDIKRNDWVKTAGAELDDRMRGEQDLALLCSKVMRFVAERIDAQVGAFYIDDGRGIFRLKASYAYKTRKHLSNEFKVGQGLVGQAALEKQPILLARVPDNYIQIVSGLGEKQPRNILVMPLVYDDAALGVIELGSFSSFSEDQRTFLEAAADRIAIGIQSASDRGQLQEALVTTQRQTEELQTQQEELKTANEELEEQAQVLRESEERLRTQQEEMEVTNEELEEKTELLQRQKRDIQKANQDLEITGAELKEKAEDLALASKYKSEFLANMSHELRTPLNSLLLLSETLSDNKTGNLTQDQVQSADIIRDSGHQLLSLINEILDLSKIEAGRMEVHREEIVIRDLGTRAENNFKHMADAKGIGMTVEIDPSVPAVIESDGGKVEQILRNLLNNAIKFTAAGSVTVSFARPLQDVTLRKSGLDPAGTLAVSVRDTGIGIPPDKQKIIFEAFQQADGGTARQYGGTGLGLSISRELARLLGGEIQMESVPDQGSAFTLYLPEKLPDEKMKPVSADAAGEKKSPFQKATQLSKSVEQNPAEPSSGDAVADDRDGLKKGDKTILIVEDDARFARLLLKDCQERGFKVIVAGTGIEGVSLAETHVPDAIILDIRLPGMDGWSVLQILKENPHLRHIPVHFISADEPTMEAFRKGAVGYLKKPVSRDDLEQAFVRLEDIIERKMKNLLVVEDNDQLRKSIMQLIGNGDVHTDEAATGAEALAAIQNKCYDCVILDWGLPDMSGFDVLKALGEEGTNVIPPVIVYTGRELSQDEERGLMAYTDSIIIKGVRSEERLLDEASLFLHRMVSKMPEKKRKIITDLHDTDVLFRDKTLLMVDDDMRNVFALSRILEEKGMHILKAEDGQRALDVLEKHPDTDIILMDIMMPVMDGYEAMRRIRSQERFRKLPIIALTAKAMTKDRSQCIEAGANDYLPKPVDVQRLLSMMRVWLYR